MISFKSVQAYYAKPSAQSTKGLILLQEWWGVNNQIKHLSDQFAQAGFHVLCPDLYHGKVTSEASEANHLMSGLNFQAAVNECQDWAEYLRTEQKCSSVGVTGTCMGGALAFCCAFTLSPKFINAAAPFYGIPDLSVFKPEGLQCPLICHFGEKDSLEGFSSPADVERLRQKLKECGKGDLMVHMYPNCEHAFMNKDRPEVFNKDAAKLAFDRTVAFFQKELH